MLRRPLVFLAVLLTVLALVAPVAAQDPTTPTTAAGAEQEIIPRPNSGATPDEAGDRGGALQLAVLALVVLAMGGGVFLVVRQSRQAREAG